METTREGDAPEAESLGRGRRLGLSVLIVLTLLGMVASTVPPSLVKSTLLDLTQPYLLVTGLDQSWGVFAPNPPRSSNDVLARVDRADGTVGVYPLASGDGLSEYWDYRWRKYGEQLWTKRGAEHERVAFARWFADQDRAAGHAPTRVTLVRITVPNLPAGPGPDTGAPGETPFFTLPVAR
ncbi:hypothetical protein [Actinomycetospora aeridis]|uniref:Uncharacterized protein n=1 Tax=Actinomycetospora aeridis TaxID=3129231 RepID=A0ABU8MXU1_9PSEU